LQTFFGPVLTFAAPQQQKLSCKATLEGYVQGRAQLCSSDKCLILPRQLFVDQRDVVLLCLQGHCALLGRAPAIVLGVVR